MEKLSLSITRSLAPKLPGANFCVFSDGRNYIPEFDAKAYLAACRNYARENATYLVPCRVILRDHLCMVLFDDSGKLQAIQPACHLNLVQVGVFRRGNTLQLCDTPFGRMLLAVDTDIYHLPLLTAAVCRGAQTIVSSQYIELYDYTDERILYGAFSAAQTYGVQVINVNNVNCSVCMPRALTYDHSGFAIKLTDQLPVGLKMDVARLRRTAAAVPDCTISPALLATHTADIAP